MPSLYRFHVCVLCVIILAYFLSAINVPDESLIYSTACEGLRGAACMTSVDPVHPIKWIVSNVVFTIYGDLNDECLRIGSHDRILDWGFSMRFSKCVSPISTPSANVSQIVASPIGKILLTHPLDSKVSVTLDHNAAFYLVAYFIVVLKADNSANSPVILYSLTSLLGLVISIPLVITALAWISGLFSSNKSVIIVIGMLHSWLWVIKKQIFDFLWGFATHLVIYVLFSIMVMVCITRQYEYALRRYVPTSLKTASFYLVMHIYHSTVLRALVALHFALVCLLPLVFMYIKNLCNNGGNVCDENDTIDGLCANYGVTKDKESIYTEAKQNHNEQNKKMLYNSTVQHKFKRKANGTRRRRSVSSNTRFKRALFKTKLKT